MANDWVYVYFLSNCGKYVLFDRSVPRDCIDSVDDIITELRNSGKEAFYTVGFVFKGALI